VEISLIATIGSIIGTIIIFLPLDTILPHP
jgi:hypothetical protein